MESGKLRHRVMLQRRVDHQKGKSGAVTYEYEDVAWARAQIMPGRGREFFAAAQIQATAICEIKIRFRADIDETWRIAHIRGNQSPPLVDYWDVAAPPVADGTTMCRDLLLYCTRSSAEGWRGNGE